MLFFQKRRGDQTQRSYTQCLPGAEWVLAPWRVPEYTTILLKLTVCYSPTAGRSWAWEVPGGAWPGSGLRELHSFHLGEPALTQPHLA